jgi:hypothetical protein
MRSLTRSAPFVLFALLAACGSQLVEFPDENQDAGNPDAESTDAASPGGDAGPGDATLIEAGSVDSGIPDSGSLDAGEPDSGDFDSGKPDSGGLDAADAEAGELDASDGEPGERDANDAEAGDLDAGDGEAGDADAEPPDAACAQAPVPLGGAGSFGVLAGSTVTSTGATSITGDLGVWPGTAVTGFGPGTFSGSEHAGDPTAQAAQADLTKAYLDAAGRVLCAVTVSGNLGGQTLTPGLYKSTSSLAISSGNLTLDAQGDPNAVFIFQMASTLTTTSGLQVILSGGASSANIYWQVGTSATLGSTSVLQGTIMANQAISMDTGATLNGRALASVAGVTLQSNSIVVPP